MSSCRDSVWHNSMGLTVLSLPVIVSCIEAERAGWLGGAEQREGLSYRFSGSDTSIVLSMARWGHHSLESRKTWVQSWLYHQLGI